MYDVLQREIPLPETPSVTQPKSSHGSFKSFFSPLVKVGLAVTVVLVFLALVTLLVMITILFLKVSALEAGNLNSSVIQRNKTEQYNFYSLYYSLSSL